MKNFAWTTDTHLNFLEKHVMQDVFRQFANLSVDGYIITGDISEAPLLVDHLKAFEATVRRPVYFVLGNHDIWNSGFAVVHDSMRELMSKNSNLVWLPAVEYVKLTDKTAIAGQDGWYDGGHGNWKTSQIRMNDWWKISEFNSYTSAYSCDMRGVMSYCSKLALECARNAKSSLANAFSEVNTCLFATHIPPWLEVSSYRGQPTDLQAQPFYISKHMGDHLEEAVINLSSDKNLRVFAGHTHFTGDARIGNKIHARVGHAQYGMPTLVDILQVE